MPTQTNKTMPTQTNIDPAVALSDARKRFDQVPENFRAIFQARQDAARAVEEIEAAVIQSAQQRGCNGVNVAAQYSDTANLKSVLATIESSPAFIRAKEILSPLVAEIAEYEARDAKGRQEVDGNYARHQKAIADAEARARLEALQHPNVLAALDALNASVERFPTAGELLRSRIAGAIEHQAKLDAEKGKPTPVPYTATMYPR
jgi:hypothetical protein